MKQISLFHLLSIAVAACLPQGISSAEDPQKPNVLFISIDDLNDWIGCLGGHPQAQTPNLDKLAARGTLFLNAHCQSPVCNPSRTSVMMGLRPTTTGVYSLQPAFRTVPKYRDYVSMPKAFQASGYVTSNCGKMYHKDAGKDEFEIQGGPKVKRRGRPKERFVSQDASKLDWGPFPAEDAEQRDYHTASWAVEQLQNQPAQPKKPFFMTVGFYRPHVPLYASQKWFDLYPEESLLLPPIRRSADPPIRRSAAMTAKIRRVFPGIYIGNFWNRVSNRSKRTACLQVRCALIWPASVLWMPR